LIGLMAGCVHLSAKLRGLDGFLLIVAAVLSWAAMSLPDQPPAELSRRPWFISHGLAFAASAVCFAAGGAAGVGYLLVSRMLRRHRTAAMIGTVASLESLERFGRWMWLIGFPLFTYGILTGFCGIAHRQDLRQTTWYLDPTLIASLVAWGIYAYLCVASLYGPTLRARRAAVLSTYGLGLVLVAYVIREFSWLHH
ncbi:MAG: cytochrome c biogenesis protein, partial [Phycisphaerae bacterium]|nr:cytochrome c biogenesis protein [Phycisphaerae bacterium]